MIMVWNNLYTSLLEKNTNKNTLDFASYSNTSIVCSNIMAHLDEYKLLSDRQRAFRKRHSCETQLITIINDWTKILDNGGFWILRKHLTPHRMSSLRANCLAVATNDLVPPIRHARNHHSLAFQTPLLILTFTSAVSSPRLLEIGIHLQVLSFRLLKV